MAKPAVTVAAGFLTLADYISIDII
jgi:hypothetical protein